MTDDNGEVRALPTMPRLMSTAEVADLVRRSERTVREWVQRGLLRRRRVGRGVYFLETDVLAAITGDSENHKSK